MANAHGRSVIPVGRRREAECTCNSSSRPTTVGVHPLTFLPASYPRGPRASVVFTLWMSMPAAVGETGETAARPGLPGSATVLWLGLDDRDCVMPVMPRSAGSGSLG